ncbi:hypothetical protein LFL96_34060 [Paraburkholderia sp. D15]|uniref:hypothetical protein n=1 Tax=Paraburkholderia sp. D15 TaxID=2880218 RepID=UPI002479898E|nr:hypothetical protein [Paraburkholderia sp. D15]WGS53190.1 hypothetical protein LFL96_34060 [Paraburkholderia sp. D15]
METKARCFAWTDVDALVSYAKQRAFFSASLGGVMSRGLIAERSGRSVSFSRGI